jgi:methylamine dehydrogenase heavy chain
LERAGQGPRTDVLTITDKSHLTATTSDIVLSKTGKRGFVEGNSVDLTHNRKFILSLNFTPASSVFVVDAQKRRLINEVPIPGCTSIYPTGAQGFSSLCENGTLTTFALGDKGQVVHESHTVAFNDIDHDVLWMEPVTTRAKTYFVSARGNVRPIDTTQSEVTVEPTWPLISKEEATDGWRTSGGLFTASDDAGRLYVRLYRDTGYAGQLKSNTEVWIFDPSNRTRILRIPLKNGATSIDVTRGPNPYLVVVADTDSGAEGSVDVYDAATGRFLRTIGGWLPGIALNLVQAKR